jgi:uracil phosphoribosyltransferase
MATQTPTIFENTRPGTQAELAGGVVPVNHPLVQYHVAKLRDQTTAPPEFRNSVCCLAELMAYEATIDMPVVETRIHRDGEESPHEEMLSAWAAHSH